MRLRHFAHCAVALLFALTPAGAKAAFISPSWSIGAPNSTYQEWDFLSGSPALPDVGSNNPNGTAGYTLSGGFLTGGGNAYSFASDYSNTVAVPDYNLGAGYDTTILLQIRTQGSELLPGSIFANGFAPASTVELSRGTVNVPGQGDVTLVETAFTFQLSGNSALDTLTFGSAIHSSLVAFRVDTQATAAVPEAGSLAMAAAAALAAVGARKFLNRGR